jgi:hypothetical protein
VPLGLPNVVTTPTLRVETIVVEPSNRTTIVSPPAMTAMRSARVLPAGVFEWRVRAERSR